MPVNIRGGFNQVLWAQTPLLIEMMRSYKCPPRVIKVYTLTCYRVGTDAES